MNSQIKMGPIQSPVGHRWLKQRAWGLSLFPTLKKSVLNLFIIEFVSEIYVLSIEVFAHLIYIKTFIKNLNKISAYSLYKIEFPVFYF